MEEAANRSRANILEWLRSLQERIGNRNQDLSEDEAMALAVRFSREFIDDLAAEGKLTFQRDQRERTPQ